MEEMSCFMRNPLDKVGDGPNFSSEAVDLKVSLTQRPEFERSRMSEDERSRTLEEKTLDKGMLESPDHSGRYSPEVNIISVMGRWPVIGIRHKSPKVNITEFS